jgi:hypothetical protein
MDKPFDNGVEVDDAIRLGDAFTQIRETFQARQLSDKDRAHPSFSFYTELACDMPFYDGDSARDDWVRGTVLQKLSEEKVSNALKSGDLPVYFITRNQTPARFNPDEFCRRNWNSHITITAGSYHNENGDNHLGSPYHGANLFVKNKDWGCFVNGAATKPVAYAHFTSVLPTLSATDLEKWWGELSDDHKAKPHTDLHNLCKSAHPLKLITRERIRALAPGRKRGPKPFGGKATA